MSWQETYRRKSVTADEAVKHINSGDHVVLSHCVDRKSTRLNSSHGS